MPTQHAKYSPSSFFRRANCPGSGVYESLAPASPPSKDSEAGTFAHAVGEYCLRKRKHPSKLVGKQVAYDIEINGELATKKQTVTREVAFAVGKYYNYVIAKSRDAKLYIETKVKLKKDLWGTLDCGFARGETLYDVDYKNGFHNVEPKNNLQLIIYGLGLLKKLKNNKIKRIKLVIVQPRSEGPTIKEWTVSRSELEGWLPYILKARKACKRSEKGCVRLKVGAWCRWCKGSPFCPERLRSVKKVAELEDIEIVPLHKLYKLQQSKDLILEYLDKIDQHFMRLIMQGAKIPRRKVVKKRATTRWKYDEEKMIKLFRKRKYTEKFVDQHFFKRTIRTPNQLIDVLGNELVEKWTEKKSSGVKLVDESHPSEPVNTLLEDMMED